MGFGVRDQNGSVLYGKVDNAYCHHHFGGWEEKREEMTTRENIISSK